MKRGPTKWQCLKKAGFKRFTLTFSPRDWPAIERAFRVSGWAHPTKTKLESWAVHAERSGNADLAEVWRAELPTTIEQFLQGELMSLAPQLEREATFQRRAWAWFHHAKRGSS